MKGGKEMKLSEAIEVLKDAMYIGSDEYASNYDRRMKEAIDTVVEALEKPTPILEQYDDKRLLFSAYLQGKRDQIYFATKWEELKSIGKYRMIKQFLNWYQTLKLKEIGQ